LVIELIQAIFVVKFDFLRLAVEADATRVIMRIHILGRLGLVLERLLTCHWNVSLWPKAKLYDFFGLGLLLLLLPFLIDHVVDGDWLLLKWGDELIVAQTSFMLHMRSLGQLLVGQSILLPLCQLDQLI